MEKLVIPPGYQQVMPYLILPRAEGFLPFMKKVFGATEKYKAMRDDTNIMHGELQVGESTIMYASSTDQIQPHTAGLFIYVPNADETYEKALAEGAESVMKMSDQSYGRSGGVRDPFGNVWWITTDKAGS
jgi:PhnB protein